MVFEPKVKKKPIKKTFALNCILIEEEHKLIGKECIELNISRSEFIRSLLCEYFKNKK